MRSIAITPAGTVIGAGPVPLPGIPSVIAFGPSGPLVSTPQIVPVQPVVSQVFNITLNNQACTIKIYFRTMQIPSEAQIPTDPSVFEPIEPCFVDLYVNDQPIIGGVRGMNENLIVRDTYLGFVGDLSFIDVSGQKADPQVDGLGSRFLLTYWPLLP